MKSMGSFPLSLRYARLCVLLVLWNVYTAFCFIPKPMTAGQMPPEMWMSSVQLIRRWGYPVETHVVRTDDGYLLELHRIPPRNGSHGTPVLFGHGLGSNDEQWLLRSEENLTFLLSDRGFDIWLGNYRGSYYGRRHISLSVKSRKFWDFSWHENGVYDQAAMIDHILSTTGRPALLTLGHSLGGTVQLVLLAERPEYADKVLGCILLAPPSSFKFHSSFGDLTHTVIKHYPHLKSHGVNPKANVESAALANPLPLLCYPSDKSIIANPVCMILIEMYMGPLHEPLNKELLQLHAAHWPNGASNRQALHYLQLNAAGSFLKYNFGPTRNLELYGSRQPPEYNLSHVLTPMYHYYSRTDSLVPQKNAEQLKEDLPNVKSHIIDSPVFNHLDFLIGSNAYEAVYKHVIDDMQQHVSPNKL